MGGGHAPTDPPYKVAEEERPLPLPSVAGVRLADAPILLLVCFHTAVRAELAELRRVAVAAAADGKSESHSREFAVELSGRFEFLKLVYKYHCAAEDEVVFLALDAHVKNVACTYSLEHESIDPLFDSVFCCLNALEESENISKSLQELVFCIGTIQSSFCKHMLKEEKQVFPLLVKQFSYQEQASLVWQFIGSIPLILLQDFLPWMMSFFHPDEQEEITNFIKEVLQKEKLVQEVVVSCLLKKHQTTFGFHTELAKGVRPLDEPSSIKDKFKFHFIKRPLGWKKMHCFQTNVGNNPVDGLLLWHGAIQKDLKEILAELHQIKISSCFQNLDFIVLRLKFLADVIIFYSNALEFLYPVLVDVPNIQLSLPIQNLHIASHIEYLLYLLHYNDQRGMPTNEFVEKLCQKLESFAMNVDKQFSLQEKKLFPVISKNCSEDMQQQLLCMSLHVLPLGLLKCVITWFAAHLSEDESRSILRIINQRNLINKSFASLLLEWFHIGYSGKTSVESFRRDLEKIFRSRISFLHVPIEEDAESSSLLSDMLLCKGSKSELTKQVFVNKGKKGFSFSSASSDGSKHSGTSYCSRINLHIFFPKTIRDLYSFANFAGEKSCVDSAVDGPIPMDLIFFFHRALKKDLDYLVLGSAQLAENVGFLAEFHQRFNLIKFLYQIHSDAEDEVAFPALEAKGKLRNISHSYTLDHKMEVENFNKISLILDEMYKLYITSSSGESITLDGVVKHQQLCIDLQDTCKSMHKLLSDHVHREEAELWPLFRECFSLKEQEKIIGSMLGRTGAEILQDMIPWLMASLTPDEQQAVMSLWHMATRNTMFDEWLGEWWEGHTIVKAAEESTTPSWTADPLEIISSYFPKVLDEQDTIYDNFLRASSIAADIEHLGMSNIDNKIKSSKEEENYSECSECSGLSRSNDKQCNEASDLMGRTNEPGQKFQGTQNSGQCKHQQTMSQEDLEAAIRRVCSDTSLDPERKSHVMQNLLMSRWILTQQIYNLEVNNSNTGEEIPCQHPSYRDPLKLALGCKHYKRNCKLFATCCNQLYTCIRCHDEVADHSLDRKSVTKMMCMKCLIIQPIGYTCSTISCNNLSMGKYYCRICKLFDDEREIYHCPYCNLCRVGKGLGIDYFHCMNCNACMSRSLLLHICREKSFEDNCPICHEDFFSSTAPVKSLPCGHMMHSICFEDYSCTHYTCPICSKSLGDMQVYFKMLDALLAEEKIPDEYHGRTQAILCNDCEKKGTAPFHWLYHKCSNCGSYNTRLL